MLNFWHNVGDTSSRLVELHEDGDESIPDLTTAEAAIPLRAPAPKTYALPAQWEQHRDRIRQLYLDENKPLREVMEIMGRDYRHFGRYVQSPEFERLRSALSNRPGAASNSIRTKSESGGLIPSTRDIRPLGRDRTSGRDDCLRYYRIACWLLWLILKLLMLKQPTTIVSNLQILNYTPTNSLFQLLMPAVDTTVTTFSKPWMLWTPSTTLSKPRQTTRRMGISHYIAGTLSPYRRLSGYGLAGQPRRQCPSQNESSRWLSDTLRRLSHTASGR